MLQTNPRFMAKLLEQLGGCAAIKAEFLGASQDARYKEGIRALISLWQGHLSCLQGPCGGHKGLLYQIFTHLFHVRVL